MLVGTKDSVSNLDNGKDKVAMGIGNGPGPQTEEFRYWTENTDRQRRAVNYIRDYREAIKDSRRLREEIWLECYNIYRQQHQHNAYEGRARIYLPSGFVAVETIAPRLILGLMGQLPFIKVVPRRNATADRAKKISKLLDIQADQAELFWNILAFVKQMTIYGRGRGKTWWDRRVKKVMRKGLIPKVRTNDFGQVETYQEYGGVPEEQMKFDGPRFRTVDPFRLFEDDMPDQIADRHCQIERMVKRETSLADWEKAGYYGNLKGIDQYKSSGRELYSYQEIQRMQAQGISVDNLKTSEGRYDVSEYWGLFDIHDDGNLVECKLTTLADQRLICIEPNPFWHNDRPYLDCPYIPLDQELDGIGILEPIRSLVYEQNDTHNQVMDNKTLMLNNMWLMDENAHVRISDLKSRPGGVVRTKDMKGLVALRPPDFTSAGYQAFVLLERLQKEATGATNPMIGVGSAGEQTATEVNSLISEGNVRNRLTLKLLEERLVKPLIKKWYSMDEQLFSRAIYTKVIEGGTEMDLLISPNDVYGDYDFEPQGAMSMQAESVKNQQKIAFFSIAAKFAPQVVPFLLTQIWKDMDQRGGEELEKLFVQYPQLTTGLVPPGQPGPVGAPSNITTPGQVASQSGNMGKGPAG